VVRVCTGVPFDAVSECPCVPVAHRHIRRPGVCCAALRCAALCRPS
jgi:hypothetical protein